MSKQATKRMAKADEAISKAKREGLSVETVNGPLCTTCASSVADDEPENIVGTCSSACGCYNCEA